MTWKPGPTTGIDATTAPHLAFPFALTTRDGTHIVTYRAAVNHDVQPSGYVVAARSTDDGATWHSPVVLSNCEGDERSAKLAQAPDGTIYAAVWAWRTGDKTSIRSMLRTSTDDGASWSYPQPLNFPHTSWSAVTGLLWHGDQPIAAAYGSDGGEQYVALSSGGVVASGGGNWQEPALIANGDELLCFLRYESGATKRIYLSRSFDGGTSWSAPQHIIDGGGQPAPHFAPDGALLLAYRAPNGNCAWASSGDGGLTWAARGRYVDWASKWVYGDWLTVEGRPALASAFEPTSSRASVHLTTFDTSGPTIAAVSLPLATGTMPASVTVGEVVRDGVLTVDSYSTNSLSVSVSFP